MAETKDELLVKKFNQGDDSAFDIIAQEYSADIAKLANRLAGRRRRCHAERLPRRLFRTEKIPLPMQLKNLALYHNNKQMPQPPI